MIDIRRRGDSMKDSFWKQFEQTGKVDYYMNYREKEACRAIADDYGVKDGAQAERERVESAKNSDGDRA